MFPSQSLSHNDAINRIVELRSLIDPVQVGADFIAGLSKNNPALRSALGSYAVALNMPLHTFAIGQNRFTCTICGAYENEHELDRNILNFERHKWGGVRHSDPYYMALDLERFVAEPGDEPLPSDWDRFNCVLQTVAAMPKGAKLSELLRAIKPIVPGNDYQRRAVIGILGYAGVLRVPSRSGFLRSFTCATDRAETSWSKDDWPYPTRWWHGGEGVDGDAIAFWFGKRYCNQTLT